MVEKSSEIEREIASERGRLGYNINELESRVHEATDWRAQFQKKPMLMMGAALAGGLVLSSIIGKRSRSQRRYAVDRSGGEYEHRRGTELQKNKAFETFDNIKGAIIGVTANSFKDFLSEAIPGFREQFQKTAQEKHGPAIPSEPRAASTAAGAD